MSHATGRAAHPDRALHLRGLLELPACGRAFATVAREVAAAGRAVRRLVRARRLLEQPRVARPVLGRALQRSAVALRRADLYAASGDRWPRRRGGFGRGGHLSGSGGGGGRRARGDPAERWWSRWPRRPPRPSPPPPPRREASRGRRWPRPP